MAETSLTPQKLSPAMQFKNEGIGAFFRISLIFLIITSALSGSLYLYKLYMDKHIADQTRDLALLKTDFDEKTIKELESISNAIAVARALIKDHVHATKVFSLIEENTLPDVNYTAFSYTTDRKAVILSAQASSYTQVSQQTRIFQTLPEVAAAVFSGSTLNENGTVNFTLNMNLK